MWGMIIVFWRGKKGLFKTTVSFNKKKFLTGPKRSIYVSTQILIISQWSVTAHDNIVVLRNRMREERRRQTLCDKRENKH